MNRVMYPGLASHPSHEVVRVLLPRGSSGCVWFHVGASKRRVQQCLPGLQVEFKTSFGGAACRLDPWPMGGAHDIYDGTKNKSAQSKKGRSAGTWLRLSLGYEETAEEVLRKLRADLQVIMTPNVSQQQVHKTSNPKHKGKKKKKRCQSSSVSA